MHGFQGVCCAYLGWVVPTVPMCYRPRYDGGMSNGKVLIRMPISLHRQLIKQAAEQGVSLNQLCVSLLAGATSFNLEEEP